MARTIPRATKEPHSDLSAERTSSAVKQHLALPSDNTEPLDATGASERIVDFQRLATEVQNCRMCPRMEGRTRVLGVQNGTLESTVLFIAEAPGRFGADSSGIPLFGDRSGRNFEILMQAAGFERSNVFITNAVLCNPRDLEARNAKPTRHEIQNCSSYLRQTLEIIRPQVVVTLGVSALEALALIHPHNLLLSRDIGIPIAWLNTTLVALYHPGPRACIRRPLNLQREDYARLAQLISDTY